MYDLNWLYTLSDIFDAMSEAYTFDWKALEASIDEDDQRIMMVN